MLLVLEGRLSEGTVVLIGSVRMLGLCKLAVQGFAGGFPDRLL